MPVGKQACTRGFMATNRGTQSLTADHVRPVIEPGTDVWLFAHLDDPTRKTIDKGKVRRRLDDGRYVVTGNKRGVFTLSPEQVTAIN